MERLDDLKKRKIINNAVELGLEGRKKRVVWPRNVAVAAASVIIGIPVFGYTFPALAEHIPLIGSIFSRTEDMQDLSDYAMLINEIQVADGVSFTLNEALFDGRNVLLTYLVESERPIRSEELEEDYHFGMRPYHLDSTFKLLVDGEEVPTGLSSIDLPEAILHWIDDYTFFFVYHIPLIRDVSPRLSMALENADSVDIFIRFSDLGYIDHNPDFDWDLLNWDDYYLIDAHAQGPWEFTIALEQSERQNIYVGQRFHQYDVDASDTDDWQQRLTGFISSVSVTPNQLSFDYFFFSSLHQLIMPENMNEIILEYWQTSEWLTTVVSVDWQVTDQYGRPLWQSQHRTVDSTGEIAQGTVVFDDLETDLTHIFIVPTITRWQANIREDANTGSEVIYKGIHLDTTELDAIVVRLP